MLNVVQRVGGSLGVALFTVILENGIDDRRGPRRPFGRLRAHYCGRSWLA